MLLVNCRRSINSIITEVHVVWDCYNFCTCDRPTHTTKHIKKSITCRITAPGREQERSLLILKQHCNVRTKHQRRLLCCRKKLGFRLKDAWSLVSQAGGGRYADEGDISDVGWRRRFRLMVIVIIIVVVVTYMVCWRRRRRRRFVRHVGADAVSHRRLDLLVTVTKTVLQAYTGQR